MLTGWMDFDDTLRTLDQLQRRIDHVFEGWSDPRPWRRGRPAWPATNVFETKEAFVVKAPVPGLTESDVSVSVEDDSLVLRGERKADLPEGYKAHVRERAPVAFNRKIALPAHVDADAVSATLHDGVLIVTLPKSKEALPRTIAVKAT